MLFAPVFHLLVSRLQAGGHWLRCRKILFFAGQRGLFGLMLEKGMKLEQECMVV